MRFLLKAHEVIDEIMQHEDCTVTFRVFDLTSCGRIEMLAASLGGVDRFGCLIGQDSKAVMVYSHTGVGIVIGQKPLVSLGARGKFNVLECDSREGEREQEGEEGRGRAGGGKGGRGREGEGGGERGRREGGGVRGSEGEERREERKRKGKGRGGRRGWEGEGGRRA